MVESGIETGDLRQVRANCPERTDGSEVVRLMKRSQGHEPIKLSKNTFIDEYRCAECGPAVDDAVSRGDQPAFAAMTLYPREYFGEKRLCPRAAPSGQRRSPKTRPAVSTARRCGAVPIPLDLPFGDERQVAADIGLEESEFEARGPGIEGEGVAAHRPMPPGCETQWA